MEGWIKLHRQITENEFYFSERFTKVQAWIDLLVLANHKPNTIFIRGVEVRLERGQLGYAIKSLAIRWKWNERTVNKFLNILSKREMIQYKKNNVTTIISIKNYGLYQGSTEQNTEQNTEQSNTKIHTDNNDNNEKNEKNNNGCCVNFATNVINIFFKKYRLYREETHPALKLEQQKKIIDIINTHDYDLETYKDMMTEYFYTKFGRHCDYRINHFFMDAVLDNRYHENKQKVSRNNDENY